MNTTKSYVVTPRMNGEVKSIPLSETTSEMWRTWRDQRAVQHDAMLTLYEQVAWFRRAVDIRAEALANLPFVFERLNGEPLDEGELPPLPFALELDHLLNVCEAWLVLYGAAYLFKGLNAARVPKLLRPLHPATVSPQFDELTGLTGFERRAGNGGLLRLAVEDVVYLWLPPRKAEIGPGVPPGQAAAVAASLLRAGDGFAEMYFDNGIIAPTLVTVPVGTPDSEVRRIQSWAQRAMSGLKKAFNVLAFSDELKVTSLGEQIPLGSLALPEMTEKKREDIATAFGIPQSMLTADAANYATSHQDKLNFYDETIIPEARRVEAALNRQLFEALGYRLRFRPDRMEVYQSLEAEKAGKIAVLVGKPIFSVNEGREQMGLEPVPGGSWEDAERERAERREADARRAEVLAEAVQQRNPAQDAINQTVPAKAVTEAAGELARWERKALRRFEEGKPDKAREFESDVLGAHVKAWLAGQLAGAATADDVKAAFAAAAAWLDYP